MTIDLIQIIASKNKLGIYADSQHNKSCVK